MSPRAPHVLPAFLPALLLILAMGAPRDAGAQGAPSGPRMDRTFSPQLFRPAPGPDHFFTVEPAAPLPHLNFSVGLWFNFARDSYVLSTLKTDGSLVERGKPLEHVLGADLVFALGILDRIQIGLGVPLTLYQNGVDRGGLEYNGQAFALATPQGAFAFGDPWLDVKVRVYGRGLGPNLALAALLNVPGSLATPDNFGGDTGVGVGGKVMFGWEGVRWRAGLQVGALWRQKESVYLASTVGTQLQYGAAFAYDVLDKRRLTVLAEVHGRTGLTGGGLESFSVSNLDNNALELDVGVKARLSRMVFGNLGLGTGVVRGLGSPMVRVFAGITIAPDRRDRDKDGVPDSEDKCPDAGEDKDGFQDEDGCPELDNDGDGMADNADKCPGEAEDFDGFEDDDGCPEADNDRDGVPDVKDACPADREDGKPPRHDDGCPLEKTDSDGDGVFDNADKCPLEAEDPDGFQDDDGCLDADNDGDDFPDGFDQCPNAAEDKDNFEDDDGCPEPDNDGDGVLDGKDRCPTQPETVNGVADEDGCPDRGPALKVQIVGDEILLLDKVFFKKAKAVIEPKSFNLLDQLASILKSHPELLKVVIEGHTDGKGKRPKNIKLSQDRANAVRLYVAKKGVAAGRLIAKGKGPDRPVASNKTERGREANRRVEFHVIERAPQPAAPAAAPESGGATP